MRTGCFLAPVRHDQMTVDGNPLLLLFEQADGAELELIGVMQLMMAVAISY